MNQTQSAPVVEVFAAMTNLQLKGSWNEVKDKLKQKYGQLTDDGLRFAEEKEEGLLGRFAEETRQIKRRSSNRA